MKKRANQTLRKSVIAVVCLTASVIAATIFTTGCASTTRAAATRAPAPRAVNERIARADSVSRIREIELFDPAITADLDGLRVAFVSDIHFRNNFSRERLDRLVAEINAQKPDCVIIGGDNTLGPANIEEFADAVAAFRAPQGVYAVIGNHDFFNGRRKSIETLRNAGIIVLDETTIETPRGLVISGINDLRDVFPPMQYFRETIPKKGFAILVSHNPDFVENVSSADLSRFGVVLSGHTHGGQITFFGYAPVIPSAYGQRYRTGTVYKEAVPVVISNGAGFGGMLLRFRFCAPSDFLLITLRALEMDKDSK